MSRLVEGRWYFGIGSEPYMITNARTGTYRSLRGRVGEMTLDAYREFTAADLDAYQDRISARVRDEADAEFWAPILAGLAIVRRDNGLPAYRDRRLESMLRLVGSTSQPDPDWQDRVRAKVAAGLFPPPLSRPGWLRRLWSRVTGGGR